MAYIADLAPYDYHPGAPDALAVGWLDTNEPFPTGNCPRDVRDWLAELARRPVRVMRGSHYCEFCLASQPSSPRKYVNEAIRLVEPADISHGNGEIWVTASDGTNYAAPALLVHYIDAHHYLPPDPFLRAVRDARGRAVGGGAN